MMDLCRYMSFQRFCEILFNQELVLVKPEKWNDGYENYLYRVIQNNETKEKVVSYLQSKQNNVSNEQIQEMLTFVNVVCDSTHCLCFSKSIDSEVMWNAYSYNSKAIMLITSDYEIEKLNSPTTGSFDIKRVKYDLEDVGLEMMMNLLSVIDNRASIINYDQLFLHKRKCFEYENEFRLIVSNSQNRNNDYVRYQIKCLSEFIKGVMVHPLADDFYSSLIEKMCTTFNVKYLGKSKIYNITEIY